MAKLITNIAYPMEGLLEIVHFVTPTDNRMPKDYTVEYSNVCFAYNSKGTRRIYYKDVEWDGTAYDHPLNLANICITDSAVKTLFPMVWWPNEDLPGNYVRGTYLKTVTEFLVYTTAHELRHLEQWKNPRMKLLGSDFEGSDDETDADLYAILKLNEWRKL